MDYDNHPITPPPELVRQWINEDDDLTEWRVAIQSARRPKPKSQAEEALTALERTVTLLMPVTGHKKIERLDTIRAALERLRELEKSNG